MWREGVKSDRRERRAGFRPTTGGWSEIVGGCGGDTMSSKRVAKPRRCSQCGRSISSRSWSVWDGEGCLFCGPDQEGGDGE